MRSKIIFLLTCLSLMFSCIKGSQKVKNKIWEDFKKSLEDKEYKYLIENSFDSIKCIDCIPSETEKLQSSEHVFKNYLNKFYNKSFLDTKEYVAFKNDSILRISYGFDSKFGDEAYNIIYMFDKKEGKFLLRGMITVP